MSSLTSALHATLPWLAYLVLLVVMASGLFLNILGLPGLWLIVLAVIVYGWSFGWLYVGLWPIVTLVVLGLVAELVEFLAGAAGAKTAGGSKRGMAGAIIGGIVGGIFGTGVIPIPIVGTIIGSVVGCFAGAYLIEHAIGRTHDDAMSISYGAAKGKVVGLVAKSGIGVVMCIVAAVAAIPIAWSPPVIAAPVAPLAPIPTTEPVTTTQRPSLAVTRR